MTGLGERHRRLLSPVTDGDGAQTDLNLGFAQAPVGLDDIAAGAARAANAATDTSNASWPTIADSFASLRAVTILPFNSAARASALSIASSAANRLSAILIAVSYDGYSFSDFPFRAGGCAVCWLGFSIFAGLALNEPRQRFHSRDQGAESKRSPDRNAGDPRQPFQHSYVIWPRSPYWQRQRGSSAGKLRPENGLFFPHRLCRRPAVPFAPG